MAPPKPETSGSPSLRGVPPWLPQRSLSTKQKALTPILEASGFGFRGFGEFGVFGFRGFGEFGAFGFRVEG